MTTTLILGAGVMGTAFSFPISDAGGRVLLVGTHLDDDWIDSIKNTGHHPKLGVQVPDRVEAFAHRELSTAFTHDPDLIVLGVSSPGIEWAIRELTDVMTKPIPIVLLTKGLALQDGDIVALPTVVSVGLSRARGWPGDKIAIGGVGGPCLAAELAARRETSVVFGAGTVLRDACSERLTASYYHVHYRDDVIGVEASAALKNFFALGVGAAAGMLDVAGPAENGALMYNPESALFSQAAGELIYLVSALGGRAESAAGLAGVGDLYGTCRAGRNSRMGRLLGQGLPFADARRKMAEDTVEGADLARTIGPAIRAKLAGGELIGDRLPLTEAILRVVCDGETFSYQF